MDQYKRVPKPKEQQENIKPNEIRITSQGRPRNYISYAVGLLEPQQGSDQQAYDTIVLKAMRRAINKAISIAEIVKRRVKGLHQVTEIHSTTITDEYAPTEEGLKSVTTKRTVSSVTVTLSKKPLDTKNIGYQPPIPESEVQPQQQFLAEQQKQKEQQQQQEGEEGGAQQPRRRRGRGERGRGRGGRRGRGGKGRGGDQEGAQEQEQAPAPVEGGEPRGRGRRGGRGRGRGGRGRGGRRGGRFGDNEGQEGAPQQQQQEGQVEAGRGRGRGRRGGRGRGRGQSNEQQE